MLVKGISSNLHGTFTLQPVNPTEMTLTFDSKMFAISTLLGRSLDSKLIDMSIGNVAFEQGTECGQGCEQGVIRVTIKNTGNSPATGKWNVMVVNPQFF